MGVIIGISGVACSGKDTAANFFVEDFGFVNISFADPIKRACAEIFDWDEETLWGPSENRNAPDERYLRPGTSRPSASGLGVVYETSFLTPRYALQRFGTEFGRHCYEDIWVEYGIRTAKKIISGGLLYSKSRGAYLPSTRPGVYDMAHTNVGGVVFPDCRFKNEIRLIKEADGILIRIKRPGAGLDGGYAAHASEAEQLSIPDSEFDFILDNSGTIEDLRNRIVEIGRELDLIKPEGQQLELPWK